MSKLKRTAIWITLLAVILKLSGFLRESIIAMEFGANEYTDGYLLSFSFITLVVAMISGGFNNVFLPLYIKHKKKDPTNTERNANGVMNAIILFFILLSVVGSVFAHHIVPLIFGDMHPTTEEVAIEISRIFFLLMGFIAFNGMLESFLQARRIFVPVQVSKLLATLMGALFALLFSNLWGIHSLAYGFGVGVVLGTFIQFFYLFKSGFRWKPVVSVQPEFRTTFLILLFPALLSSVVGQINMFVNKLFATDTIAGAVTYLNNASLLVSIPNAIFGTTIAAIIFTMLSEQTENKSKFQQTVFMGIEVSVIALLPLAVGLLVIGDAAISFIYERGQFTAMDTASTYLALMMYVPLVVTQGMQHIVSKSMYAQGKTAVILKISSTTILLNILLNWLLVKPYGYPGLALSASLVSVYYLTVTTLVVYKSFDRGEAKKLVTLFTRVIAPTVLMAVVVYLLKETPFIEHLYSLVQLMILAPLGAAVYIVGMYFLYREGFTRLVSLLRRKRGGSPSES